MSTQKNRTRTFSSPLSVFAAGVLILGLHVIDSHAQQRSTSRATLSQRARGFKPVLKTLGQDPLSRPVRRGDPEPGPCDVNEGLEPACLKERIDKLNNLLNRMIDEINTSRSQIDQLAKIVFKIKNDIGEPKSNSDSDFGSGSDENTNLWLAITDLRDRLKRLASRIP